MKVGFGSFIFAFRATLGVARALDDNRLGALDAYGSRRPVSRLGSSANRQMGDGWPIGKSASNQAEVAGGLGRDVRIGCQDRAHQIGEVRNHKGDRERAKQDQSSY